MTKPENLTKTILHGLVAVFGVLLLGLFALPYITVKSQITMKTTGYDLLDFSNPNPTTEQTFSAVVALLLVIAVCVMVVLSVVALLGDFGVISNERVSTIINWALIATALVVLVLTVLNMVACLQLTSSVNEPFKQYNVEPATAGIAGVVINLLLGLGSAASALTAKLKK